MNDAAAELYGATQSDDLKLRPDSGEPPPRVNTGLKWNSGRSALAFITALLVAGPFCFTAVDEADLGWHIALGRLIAEGVFPRRNALSWTFPNHPWYPTSWLFDWICYRVDSFAGVLGLQWFTFTLFALTLAGLTAACAINDPKHGAWLCPIIALLLVPRLTVRPHLVSWAVLAACIALCTAARDRSVKLRAACIPLIALGSNLHAGAIFSAVALAIFCAEAALRRCRVAPQVAVAAGGFLALMANPGGSSNVFYAVFHLRVYDLLKLSEFETPRVLDLPAFYLLIPLALGLAALSIRQRPSRVALVVAFALGGIWAARLAFKFYLVAGESLAAGLLSFRQRYGRRAWILGWSLLGLMALASNARRFSHLRLSPKWDEHAVPTRAVEFIRSHQLDGRYYNSFADGGYLEYALRSSPAFQDARVNAYPPSFFRTQLAIRSAQDFHRYLRTWDVGWALTRSENAPLTGNYLLPPSDWALVYWDDLSEIFVRRGELRFGAVLAENEFRYFHPERTTPGSIPQVVGNLGRTELLVYSDEVERFQRTSPNDRMAALADCAVGTRLSAQDASARCERAAKLATTEEARALVERARHLAPLP